jgi:hypothetical protein
VRINDIHLPLIWTIPNTTDGGDTATLRHRTLGSGSVTLFMEEEASKDSETGHTTERVGLLLFESGPIHGSAP